MRFIVFYSPLVVLAKTISGNSRTADSNRSPLTSVRQERAVISQYIQKGLQKSIVNDVHSR